MEESNKTSAGSISAPNQTDQEKPTKNIYPILIVLLVLLALTTFAIKAIPNFLQKEASIEKPTQAAFFLTIDNPKTEATLVNGELLIEGKTLPNTTVIVYSDLDETSLESDSGGNFKDTVIVGDQGGMVRITAFSGDGTEISKTINIGELGVLGKSDESRGNAGGNSGGNSGNNNGNNSNNEKTEEKQSQKQEEKNQNQNQAQTQTQVQNQNQNSNKSQETKTKTNTKEKSQKPLTVSDFLSNKVKIEKSAKIGTGKMIDILSSESTTEASLKKNLKLKKMETKQASNGAQLKRHAVSGIITNISGGIITLVHQIQRDRTYTIYYNDSTQISMKDTNTSTGSATPTIAVGTESGVLASTTGSATSGVLTVGMRIAVVGIPTDTGIVATRIHVIPGKAIGVFKKQPVSSTSATPILSISPTGTESATPTATQSPTIVPLSPTTSL